MEKSTNATLLLDEETLSRMLGFYGEQSVKPTSEHMLFLIKADGLTITAYKKLHNGLRSVVFQGDNAEYEANMWAKLAAAPTKEPEYPPKKKAVVAKKEHLTWRDQIGSDEVGTGDFFGPVIVAASYVDMELRSYLMELGVADSKTLSDEKIRDIAPKILGRIDYSQLHLPNAKYNKVVREGNNMNAIKAKMHNRCLLNLRARHPRAIIYQDQFAEERLYFSYLKNEPEVCHDIIFATKGESKFLSVACASVIARYSFLRHMDELSEKYQMSFPYGAGTAVDEFAARFVQKYGKEELENVAKTNFANMKKI